MNWLKARSFFKQILKVLAIFGLLYFFLSAINMLSIAFKLLGSDFAATLIQTTGNPFIGLLIGIVSTALIQSSSVTTSLTVGLVSAGSITIGGAVPIIMGANIGTTITNTLVSLGHISNKHEFRRAFAGGLMHDFFNIMIVLILFPLEQLTHILERLATFFSGLFYTTGTSLSYHSPIKTASKVIGKFIKVFLIKDLGLSEHLAGLLIILISAVMIFLALFFLVKLMRSIMLSKVERLLNQFLNRNGFISIIIGILITVSVQSSSITTSLLVPLMGAGILSLEAAFPITLGANIGTTITALLAALAGNAAGLTIAFVHLFFNIAGALLVYPVKRIRRFPIYLSLRFSRIAYKNKLVILAYMASFFIIPLAGILVRKWL